MLCFSTSLLEILFLACWGQKTGLGMVRVAVVAVAIVVGFAAVAVIDASDVLHNL